ncbi:galactose-6-phosphate isomerase, partial [Staphylococcus pseudintermedius]
MKVIIGADQYGLSLKEHIKTFLLQHQYEVLDVTSEELE